MYVCVCESERHTSNCRMGAVLSVCLEQDKLKSLLAILKATGWAWIVWEFFILILYMERLNVAERERERES